MRIVWKWKIQSFYLLKLGCQHFGSGLCTITIPTLWMQTQSSPAFKEYVWKVGKLAVSHAKGVNYVLSASVWVGHSSVVNRFSWQTLLTADSLSITPLEWQVPCLGNTLWRNCTNSKNLVLFCCGIGYFSSLSLSPALWKITLLFYCLFSSCTNPGHEISTSNSHIANDFICRYLRRSGWWIACHHSKWKCSHCRQSH